MIDVAAVMWTLLHLTWALYNRLYFTARPMEDGLAEAIDEGKIGPRDDPKARSKILADEYGWDKDLAKKIWCAAALGHAPVPCYGAVCPTNALLFVKSLCSSVHAS